MATSLDSSPDRRQRRVWLRRAPRHISARRALVALLGIVALNAFGGAWYGLGGAPGVPRDWLEGSPFETYLVPSLYLGIVVGGSHLLAVIATAGDKPWATRLAYVAASVLGSWIVVQLAIIGYVSPLQPTMLIAAAATALLAHRVAARRREGPG